jgi:glycine/D-amino acid oxidase-like deaminating enzyme
MKSRSFEVAVIGGGLVGAALAFGMRRLGARLALLDEGDVAHRAARGNFGLIWVQGKGHGLPAYGAFTQHSAREWPRLASVLRDEAGIDVALRQSGGLHVCLSPSELAARTEHITKLFAQPAFEHHALEVLDHAGVAARLPQVGPDVVGGTWCAQDGDCNPLRLLLALHAALARSGAAHLASHPVTHIEPGDGRFMLHTSRGTFECERVVLAAGLGNARLAPMVGLTAPVKPNQGQIIALERVRQYLPFPIDTIRQTDEGTILVGDAQQDRGFDEAQDTGVMAAMAERAVRVLPFLRDVRVTRAWSALRVMSPDGFPLYAQSRACPGAFLATCHSGVTLAAVHALALGPALADGAWPAECASFPLERFDVRAAA